MKSVFFCFSYFLFKEKLDFVCIQCVERKEILFSSLMPKTLPHTKKKKNKTKYIPSESRFENMIFYLYLYLYTNIVETSCV